MTKIGYIRVSTKEQLTTRQEILMKELGVEKIYIEKISGKNLDRPQLKAMFEYIREGDTVIVESISRFARNTKDLLELVDIMSEKGVIFQSKKETIDTNTISGKFMLTVFGAMAELERGYILDRQKEGIEAMKIVDGKKVSLRTNNPTGRPNAIFPDNWHEVMQDVESNKITNVKAMDILNLKKTTYYKLLKEYKEKHKL